MEDGVQGGQGNTGCQGDPGEEVCQALQRSTAHLLGFLVQGTVGDSVRWPLRGAEREQFQHIRRCIDIGSGLDRRVAGGGRRSGR